MYFCICIYKLIRPLITYILLHLPAPFCCCLHVSILSSIMYMKGLERVGRRQVRRYEDKTIFQLHTLCACINYSHIYSYLMWTISRSAVIKLVHLNIQPRENYLNPNFLLIKVLNCLNVKEMVYVLKWSEFVIWAQNDVIEINTKQIKYCFPRKPVESGAFESKLWHTFYRLFIKYCVFFGDFKIFRTLAFLWFPSVSVCVHTPGR